MADPSPSAQPEGFDQPSSPTVLRMIVRRTATLTNMHVQYRREQENSRSFAQVCTLHRYFANRESDYVNSLSVQSTSVTIWWFPHSTSSSTNYKKKSYGLCSSSQ